jgi:hypothetical protein
LIYFSTPRYDKVYQIYWFLFSDQSEEERIDLAGMNIDNVNAVLSTQDSDVIELTVRSVEGMRSTSSSGKKSCRWSK